MPKLGLFAGTVTTKENIIEPNDGDLLGALLFGSIVFLLSLYVICASVPTEGTPLFWNKSFLYEDDFLFYLYHYFATYYMFDKIMK